MAVRRVACAVSGGVDSAVAAFLLRQRGFDVTGVYMTNWDELDESGSCSGQRDLQDAELVCRHLGLPLLHVNFAKEYWNFVFVKTLAAYSRGWTPNPDVLCNRHIKFACLHTRCVQQLGFDALATGHYARTSFGDFLERRRPDADVRLLCAADAVKDQTFWLCQVPQSGLRSAMFPLGGWLKPSVKRLCHEIGLARVADRRESAGMCFIGRRRFADFIGQYLPDRPGEFVDLETGRPVGAGHAGVHHFTIGQRPRQLCVDHRRYYVARLCPDTGRVHVVHDSRHPALYFRRFSCERPHWIHSEPAELADGTFRCQMRWQNKWAPVDCWLTPSNEGVEVRLSEPMRCIAPGQFAVFYSGAECLGGAGIVGSVSLYDEGSRQPVSWSCDKYTLHYAEEDLLPGNERRASADA